LLRTLPARESVNRLAAAPVQPDLRGWQRLLAGGFFD
jgi:hypothetical protein